MSAFDLTREVLRGFSTSEQESNRAVETFRDLDRRHLYDDYAHYKNLGKLQAQAKKFSENLEDFSDTTSDKSQYFHRLPAEEGTPVQCSTASCRFPEVRFAMMPFGHGNPSS